MANVSETIVRLTLDRAAQQNTARGVRSIDDIVRGLGRGAAGGVRRLFQQFESGRNDVNALLGDIRRLQDEIDELNRTPVKVTKQGGSGGSVDRLDTIDRFGTIGTQIAGAFGNSELANVVGLIGDSADGLSKLGVAGGVTVGVLAAVSVALGEYNKQLEQQKSRLEAALNAQDIYFKAIEEFSTSDALTDISERTSANERLRQQIAETEAAVEHAFQFAVQTLGDPLARALDTAGQLPTAQLRTQLVELNTELFTNEQAIARLTQGMEANAFAANDLRDAEERFATTRLAVIQQQIAAEQETASLIRSASSDQISDRLASIRAERDAIEGVIDETYQLAAISADAREQARQFTDRLAELEEQERRLVEVVRPMVELREREAKLVQAQTDQNQAYLDNLVEQGDIQRKLTDLTTSYSEAASESASRLTEIQSTLAETLSEIETDKANELKEIERDIGKDREKIAKDQAKRLAQIEARFALDQLSAIGDRDALAAFQAKQRRDLEKAELEEDRKERVEELEDTLEEQRRTLEKRYKEQEETARKAADKAEQQERARWTKDAQLRQQAINEQINALRNAKNAEVLLYQNVQSIAQQTGAVARVQWLNIQQATATGLEFIRQGFQNTLMSIAQQVTRAPLQYSSPIGPQRATGTYTPTNPFLSTPFQFTSQVGAPQRSAPQPVVFAPQVNGSTPRQVRTEIIRHLDRFVEQW